jgi:hypothetical protein
VKMNKPWRVDVLQCRGSSYDVGKQMAEGFLKTTRGATFHRRKGHQPFGFVLKEAQAALCTYAPNIWEELHGLADGLNIPLERAAAQYSNARLSFPKRGCSSVMTNLTESEGREPRVSRINYFADSRLARGADMNLRSEGDADARFAAYVERLASVVGHADRRGPLRDYCTGLILPGERKSVEPMAAKTAPARTAAQHQSLLHFVGVAAWPDEKVLAKVREMVLPAMQQGGPIEAWIIDDTAFPKQGKHSVGGTPSILRAAWQASQLSGGGVAVDCKPRGQPAGGLPAVSAEGLGRRRRAPEQGWRAVGHQLQDQTRDRARADAMGVRGRLAARRRIDGRSLWQ